MDISTSKRSTLITHLHTASPSPSPARRGNNGWLKAKLSPSSLDSDDPLLQICRFWVRALQTPEKRQTVHQTLCAGLHTPPAQWHPAGVYQLGAPGRKAGLPSGQTTVAGRWHFALSMKKDVKVKQDYCIWKSLRKIQLLHVDCVLFLSKPFCRDIPLYLPERCMIGNGSKSSHGASSQHLKKGEWFYIKNLKH